MSFPPVMTLLRFFLPVLLLLAVVLAAPPHENALRCLLSGMPGNRTSLLLTPADSSFTSTLDYSIQNPRFSTAATPKPHLILTPRKESHVQAAVVCARRHGLQIRVRSGGHDYEGLSYVSHVPFLLVDLINLRSVEVDAGNGTAWVGAGATIGSLYHAIAQKSRTLGFPAGSCSTIGVGGHFSGGGYGTLLRKHGLAADHVIDARLVDVNGRVLDRQAMGEDLFWAIRGGGGASFGVITAWKVSLVPVPPTVTVFTLRRNVEQNATRLLHRWQHVAHRLPDDLFVGVDIDTGKSTGVQATFNSLFLGGAEAVVSLMRERFPELGLRRRDCREMRWIESVLYFAGFPTGEDGSVDKLLDRVPLSKPYFKAKSDYVREPIGEEGLGMIWRMFEEEEAEEAEMILSPYGGRMAEISESAIPFPHRAGNLYKIQYLVNWEEGKAASAPYVDWIRRLYTRMAPYVSKSPRAAYVNYRDLDVGTNGGTGRPASYERAAVWGKKYFNGNFDRLVEVKSRVDPQDFFRNEQSIPSLPAGSSQLKG